MKEIILPKFKVGDKVTHRSNPSLIMVISKLVYKKAKTNKTAFGSSIYFQTRHSYFEGMFLCEWIGRLGKHTEIFNQNVLVLTQ